MYQFFLNAFIGLMMTLFIVEWFSRMSGKTVHIMDPEAARDFKRFQALYLVIYLIMVSADWLQGPYVYALYEYYGYNKSDIALLFICGFLSSLVFGTFVGAIADKYGRKLMCIVFGVSYSISCITKLFNNFHILMLGRILSGIATSLLFSSFESWMVYEHNRMRFPTGALSQTFSYATFGNGIVAIICGLLASWCADSWGFVSPFMLSLAFLIIGTLLVASMWSENYGDSTVDIKGTFTNAITAMKHDKKIWLIGCVQSLFEAAMYTFVFMWTPALQGEQIDTSLNEHEIHSARHKEVLPFGLIFAAYMVCIMIGSSLFSIVHSKWDVSPERLGKYLFLVASGSLLVPYFTVNRSIIALAFLLFEVCCGIYFPLIGTIRGKYIPESSRAALMNFFRIGLNFLVVVVLIKVSSLSNSTVFLICSLWLLLSFFLHSYFFNLIPPTQNVSNKV